MALALIGFATALALWFHEMKLVEHVLELLPARASPPWPILDVIGFGAVFATALAFGRGHRLAALPLVVALLTAISSVARFTFQYATTGGTSTVFVLSTMMAVAMLPFAVDRAANRAGRRSDVEREGGFAGMTAVLVGLWLLIAPAVLLDEPAASHARWLGAPVAAIGALSISPAGMPTRWLNAIVGIGLIVAPLAWGYALFDAVHSLLAGTILAFASVQDQSTNANADDAQRCAA